MAQLKETTIIGNSSTSPVLNVKQDINISLFKITTGTSGSELNSLVGKNIFEHDIYLEDNKIHFSTLGTLQAINSETLKWNNYFIPLRSSDYKTAASNNEAGSAFAAKKLVEGDETTSTAISKGSNTKLIYFSGGVPVESIGNVGGLNNNSTTFKPVYLNNGSITAPAPSASIGGPAKPIYMNSSGELIAISNKVGDKTHPVWLNNGEITACSDSVGSTNKPIYINNGAFATISGNIGGANKPVYISDGAITACSYSLKADFNGLGTTATTASKGTHTHTTTSTSFTVYYSDGTSSTVSVLTGVSTPNT